MAISGSRRRINASGHHQASAKISMVVAKNDHQRRGIEKAYDGRHGKTRRHGIKRRVWRQASA